MRPEKESIIKELHDKVSGSIFVIIADYNGLTVEKTDLLRVKLSEADARVQVVKNRVMRHVANDLGLGGMNEALAGPSAMVYGSGDVARTAKILKDFIKENNLPVIKIGTMEGAILSASDVEQLASLPSREQLLAMVVGTIAAPMSQLVGVFQQKAASLLYVLNAALEKKQNN
jgi:large subunit ribosomal protein L10